MFIGTTCADVGLEVFHSLYVCSAYHRFGFGLGMVHITAMVLRRASASLKIMLEIQ